MNVEQDSEFLEKTDSTKTPDYSYRNFTEKAFAELHVMTEISAEFQRAVKDWPPYNSAHEGFAILLEETNELWQHVMVNQKKRDLEKMRKEAIQVAAVAIRFALDELEVFTWSYLFLRRVAVGQIFYYSLPGLDALGELLECHLTNRNPMAV